MRQNAQVKIAVNRRPEQSLARRFNVPLALRPTLTVADHGHEVAAQPQAKRPKKGRMAKKSLEAEPQGEDMEGVQCIDAE
jgi:hypothetical protein